MSTQSFIPRICKGSGRFAFAILVGALLALQCLLPSAAFAHARGQTTAFSSPSPQDHVRDKVGVSVVRLIATYSNGGDTVKNALECTGLGILVGSGSTTQRTYQNWVLTDGDLINASLSGCGQPKPGASLLNSLQIVASDEYSNTSSASTSYQLGQLACTVPNGAALCKDGQNQTVTENFTTTSAGQGFYTLFSFQTTDPQPYLTLNTDTALLEQVVNVGLTNQAGKVFASPRVIEPSSDVPENYLNPSIVTDPPAGATNTIEAGTPVVDTAGGLAGMYLNNETPLNISVMRAGLQAANPSSSVGNLNPLKTGWDKGIDAYYAGLSADANGQSAQAKAQYQQADGFFQAILKVKLNPQFKAAQTFDALALSHLPNNQPAPTPTPSRPGSTTGANGSFSWLLLFGVGAGVVILVLLLILVSVWVGRARKRRRAQEEHDRELERFQAEWTEARQQAEVAVQRQGAPQAQSAPVYCPNCRNQVRLTDVMCPHCRYPLSPSASGLNVRLAGSGPLPAASTEVKNNVHLPPSAPSISDQPTVQFPPNHAVTSNDAASGEKTIKRKKPISQEDTIFSVQQMGGRNLSLAVGTRSDPGLKRKHKPNEDSLFAMQGARTHNSQPQQFGLFVVADGMGGHANGQDASRMAIQTMIDFMLPRISSSEPMDDETFLKLLVDGVQNANQSVHGHNLEARADMGTTMTTALVVGATAYVANVGDSRTYLYREGQGLSKVTNDHSVVASLVEAGIIKPDDIYTHPKRNQIYRSLGEKPVVEVDTFKVDLQPGDKLLLCSDGLWDMVRDPLIQQVLSKQTGDPNKTGQDLIKAALEGGGEDNVSVIVVQFEETNAQTGMTGVQLLAKPETVTLPKLPTM